MKKTMTMQIEIPLIASLHAFAFAFRVLPLNRSFFRRWLLAVGFIDPEHCSHLRLLTKKKSKRVITVRNCSHGMSIRIEILIVLSISPVTSRENA
ncbi:hypothetical protein VNO80_02469 [Phaseolus coccineus]|uniref:Uncharacterized protein n=1 Tax=Phaseolus coccineus TaxID=3886 RepID=A0AAN9NV46_PHACN